MPPTTAQRKALRENRRLQGDLDPVEMGRRGGLARTRNMTKEELSEQTRNAARALHLKHRKQLLSLVGPALDGLEEALKLARPDIKGEGGDPSALIKVVTAILDRTGFHGKSGIEVEGEIDHTGEIVHRHELLDIDRLPLIIKRMMAAAIESDWSPSEDLEMAIKSELPMLQVKIESRTSK